MFNLEKLFHSIIFQYTVGPKPLIDLLRQRSRPYLFSNSLAPSVVGSALKVGVYQIFNLTTFIFRF